MPTTVAAVSPTAVMGTCAMTGAAAAATTRTVSDGEP